MPVSSSAAPSTRRRLAQRLRRSLAVTLLLALLAPLLIPACGSPPVKPVDGHLPQCPGSPNCVNSQAGDVAPLAYSGDGEAALTRLAAVLVEALPRTTLVEREPGYLHAECRSLILRFVDDLQCLLDAEAGVIHLRSASRLGYSDLGVNARRIETLRAAWTAATANG